MTGYLEAKNKAGTEMALEDKYDDSIRELVASVNLPVKISPKTKVKYFITGSKSIAVKIKDYVFKFPTSKPIWQSHLYDSKITSFIRANIHPDWIERIPDTQVVNLITDKKEQYYKRFSYHKYLLGTSLDPREQLTENLTYDSLSAQQKLLLAQELASFLYSLHSIPVETAKKKINFIDKIWGFDYHSNFDFDSNRERLLSFSDGRLDLKNFYDLPDKTEEQVICHNDLVGSNILVDEKSPQFLSGILDFGEVNIGSRYNDFFCLCRLSRNLAANCIKFYNQLSPVKVDQKTLDWKYLCWLSSSIKPFTDNPQEKEELSNTCDFFKKHFMEPFIKDLQK